MCVAMISFTLTFPHGISGASACHSVRDVSTCSRKKLGRVFHLVAVK